MDDILKKENGTNNTNIIEKSIIEQNDFCNNLNKYKNLEYENQIRLANIKFDNIILNMFVYKKEDIVSKSIYFNKQWEKIETKKLLNALEYYSEKKKIKKRRYIYD
jgi:hypothetical protein